MHFCFSLVIRAWLSIVAISRRHPFKALAALRAAFHVVYVADIMLAITRLLRQKKKMAKKTQSRIQSRVIDMEDVVVHCPVASLSSR